MVDNKIKAWHIKDIANIPALSLTVNHPWSGINPLKPFWNKVEHIRKNEWKALVMVMENITCSPAKHPLELFKDTSLTDNTLFDSE